MVNDSTNREGKDKDKLHFTVGNMRLELKRKVKKIPRLGHEQGKEVKTFLFSVEYDFEARVHVSQVN